MNNLLITRQTALTLLEPALFKGEKFTKKKLPDIDERTQKQAEAIATVTLKHLKEIDGFIDKNMQQPFKADSRERLILRIGLAQLLYMDGIKDHAAIHTSVDLAKQSDKSKIAPVINAILRKAQRETVGKKKPKTNFPKWFFETLVKDYGEETMAEILQAVAQPATLDVRLRNKELEKDYTDIAEALPTGGWRITDKSLSVKNLPGWHEGGIYIQDAASQIPAQLLASAALPDGPVLDVCAAPGGKTIQLCDLLPKKTVVAVESSYSRIRLVEQNQQRCTIDFPVFQTDATALPFAENSFAAILLDAPCSATGTLRRHPDVLLHRQERDIAPLAFTQSELLKEAARVLMPGGVLIYATCSLLFRENEQIIKAFLKKNPEFSYLPVTATELGGRTELVNDKGAFRSLPQHGMDGFFAARLIKSA